MPLRPFPAQLCIGTDIVAISRIRAILSKGDDNFQRYIRRFLTRPEQSLALRYRDRIDLSDAKDFHRISQYLAGRWAAKEATIKAVTWRSVTFHDIIIRRSIYAGGLLQAVILEQPLSSDQEAALISQSSRPSAGSTSQGEAGTHGRHEHGAAAISEKLQSQTYAPTLSTPEQEDTRSSAPSNALPEHLQLEQSLFDDLTKHVSGQIAQISISHDGDYATAVCLAAQEAFEGDVGGELAARIL